MAHLIWRGIDLGSIDLNHEGETEEEIYPDTPAMADRMLDHRYSLAVGDTARFYCDVHKEDPFAFINDIVAGYYRQDTTGFIVNMLGIIADNLDKYGKVGGLDLADYGLEVKE